MSLRIRKAAGWLVKLPSPLKLNSLESMTVQDLLSELNIEASESQEKLGMYLVGKDLLIPLKTLIKEYSLSDHENYVVFQAPGCQQEWTREDNFFDYYDNEEGQFKHQSLLGSLYPFLTKEYIVRSSLKKLSHGEYTMLVSLMDYGLRNMLEDEIKHFEALGIDLNKSTVKPQVYASAPEVIRIIANKAGVTDASVLTPGIITYWT